MIPYFSFTEIKLGPITFYTWGIFLALAFLVGFIFILKSARRNIGQKAQEIILDSFAWLVLGAVIGARLGYVLQFPEYFFSRPFDILKIWRGGMTFHGGFFGLLAAGIIFACFKKINKKLFFQISDIIALGLPVFIAIGRIGCSLINDHRGRETSFLWGIVWPDGSVRHPVAEYLIAANLFIFLFLFFLKPKLKKPGQLFFTFLFLYSVSRFFLDFTREDDLCWFYLSTAQWLSLIIILGIIIKMSIKKANLIKSRKKDFQGIKIIFPFLLLFALILLGADCGIPGCEQIEEKIKEIQEEAEGVKDKVEKKIKGQESYYEKICEISFPFQKKIMKYYGMEMTDQEASQFGYYSSVEECVEKSIELEEKMLEICLEEGEDEKRCQESIEEWREVSEKLVTRQGCENFYIGMQCLVYRPGEEIMKNATQEERDYLEEKYQECASEIKELCQDLPEEI